MSSLRNAFTVTTNDGSRDLVQEELNANGMGDLRRSWNAGRIGTEANYLAAQELGLRKDGRNDEADAVRAQIEGLQQRQALYAPTVGRVEDIHGVGDAIDWATGQVGQGAASMLDPMALAAGIGTAGRIAGMSKNPYARLFSKAAPYLAPMGAYGIGQRQLTGEMGNSMADDPTLMANTTADQRWQNANLYGGGAAMLDTFLPGHLAGKVVGKGAISALAKGGMREAGTELLGEGATEAAQEFGKQQVLGQLNPNRDTSGDASDLLNAGLGGFAGAAGPVALGAGAQAVHNRVAKTRDALGGVAGDVTDLVTGATTQAQEKGKGLMDMALGLFGRGKGPQDLQEGAPEAQDGPPGPFRLSGEDKAALDPEEAGIGPDHPEYGDRILARADFVQQKLAEMAGTDPRAAEIYQRMTANPEDYGTKLDVADEGANFLMGKHTSNELNARGEAMQENVKTVGKAVGKAAASVVKGVAKGAATFGKAAWDGATSKKNAQATGPDQDRSELASSYAEDVAGKLHDGKRGVRVLARRVTEQIIEHMSMRSNDRMYSPQRNVDAHGLGNRDVVLNRLASTVKKIYGEQAQTVLDEVGKIMNGHGKKIVDYIKKEVETLSAPGGRTHERNRRTQLADTLLSMVPPKKEAALTSAGINIRDGADREKFLSLMEDFADGTGAPGLRNRLNAVFGFETVKKMVDHLNGVAQPKEQDEHVPSGRVDPSFDSDEAMAPEEDYDAEKKWAKGEGDRIYGFHRSKTLRSRGQGAGDIFAGAKDAATGEVKRPNLLKQSDMVTGPGGKGKVSAIDKKIADLTKELGPRAAEYRVASRPVLDVMREHGAQQTAVLTAYRDYLRQDAKGMPEGPERKAALNQAMQAARAVLDSMRKPGDKSLQRLTAGERSAVMKAAKQYFSERHVVEAAKMVEAMPDQMDLPTILKMAAATRKAVDLARKPGVDGNKIMDDNNILTFSREKKPLHIRADDLVKWAAKQRRGQEASDMESNVGDMKNATRDAQYLTDLSSAISAVMSSGLVDKVMPYKTNAQGEHESFKDGIPPSLRLSTTTQKERSRVRGEAVKKIAEGGSTAGMQPEEVRQERVAKEQAQGITDNADADKPLTDDRLPSRDIVTRQALSSAERDALSKLPTLKERMEYLGSLRAGEADPEAFDEDIALNGTKGAMFNAAAREGEAKTDRFDKTPLDYFTKQKVGEEKDDYADQRYQSRVEGYDAANMTAPKSAMRMRAEVDKDAADIVKALTPLPEGKEVVMKGELGRPAEGFAMIESRLRAAARTYGDKEGNPNGLAGGIHYIYPVLKVLNGDKLGTYDFSIDEMKKAVQLRSEAAKVLLGAKVSDKQRVFLAKELATSEAAARINLANVKTALTKIAEPQAPKAEAAAPTTPAADDRAARLDKMIVDEDYSKLTTKDRVDRFLRAAKDRLPALRGLLKDDLMSPTQEKAYAALVRMFSPDSDLASFYDGVPGADGITDDQVRAMLNDASLDDKAQPAWGSGSLNRRGVLHEWAGNKPDIHLLRLASETMKRLEGEKWKIRKDALGYSSAELGKWGEPHFEVSYNIGGPLFGVGNYSLYFHDGKKFQELGFGRTFEDVINNIPTAERIANAVSTLAPNDKAASEVAAQAPKSQSAPAGARKLNAQTRVSREDVEEQVMAALEIHGEQFADGLPSAQRDEFMSLLDKAMSASRDELTGELSTGPVDLEAAKQLAEKYDVPTLRHWVSQLSDAARNDQVFPNDGPNRIASDEDMAKAKEYLAKVAPQIKLKFENITGYSGEFIEAENVIKISTTAAAGTMETAYHEALHAFFAKFIKSDPKVLAAMRTLAENEKLLARVHALLKGFPAAQRQLADGEERLAYIFQFWAAGKLDLPVGRPTTIMQKLRKFFRRVAGMITNEERAVDLMHAFHEGKLSEPSAAGRVIADIMNQGTLTPAQLRKMDGIVQKAMGMIAPAEEILARSESETARELAKEFFTNPGDEDSVGHEEGYINATRTISLKYTNKFASIVRNLTDRDMSDVVNHMVNKELEDDAEIAYAPVRDAVKSLRKLLREVYDHTTEAGVEMGEFKGSYFPRVWSVSKLTEGRDAFIKMLVDNYPERLSDMVSAVDKDGKKNMTAESIAAEIWQFLTTVTAQDGRNDVTRQDGVLAPFFASGENRHFAWIETKHSGDFQHKNLTNIVTGYIHQSVKAAEYTRRFGRSGKILEKKLKAVRAELHEVAASKLNAQEFGSKDEANKWVAERMKNIHRACGAMEGTLGKDISPTLRKFNSWMMVYQNLRLLPLTLFASVVDPLGMVARGATMKEAYETFLRGMKEVFTNWADMVRENPKERVADKWEILAEHIGALDSILFSHHVAEEYSSTYLSPGAKKVNDALFKINGMESWNRGVRAGAVRSAVKFIERHSKLPEVHSERWMRELGLTPGHIALDPFGELILDTKELAAAKGISEPEAARRVEVLHSAINRWVLGAILTPNAAQRPAWASDPHYSIFFHLKQFSYSFHQTILKRAVKEMNHGNLAPIGAFAGYIPIMIASDVVKGLIVGGGELPNHMKGYDLGDWVKHGIERSGTLGIAGIGVDASQDIFSLAGPGVEQVMDAMVDPLEQTTVRALPLSPMYAQLLK